MNGIQIITDKEVSLENLCEEEQHLFYLGILTQILELHRQEQERKGVRNNGASKYKGVF